jgi:sulfite reductase (ferredoxin)
VKTQNPDISDNGEAILTEFRTRFCDTELFYDKYAGGKFAEYLFKAKESLSEDENKAEKELALQRLSEAQLFIDAAHNCHNKLGVVRSAEPAAGAGATAPGEG